MDRSTQSKLQAHLDTHTQVSKQKELNQIW